MSPEGVPYGLEVVMRILKDNGEVNTGSGVFDGLTRLFGPTEKVDPTKVHAVESARKLFELDPNNAQRTGDQTAKLAKNSLLVM